MALNFKSKFKINRVLCAEDSDLELNEQIVIQALIE